MDWHERWRTGRYGFHNSRVNLDLEAQADWLLGDEHRGVLVPLCGKSLDLPWLVERGHAVVGVELVEFAVAQFHEEQGIAAKRSELGPFVLWRSPGLSILQGDALALTPELVGQLPEQLPLTRCWDRAALIALPPELRVPYVRAVRSVLEPGARLLLNNFEYTADRPSGPPFSVERAEFAGYFDDALELTEVARHDILDSEPRWRDRGMTRCESAVFRIQLP